jgi:hypothetical protein
MFFPKTLFFPLQVVLNYGYYPKESLMINISVFNYQVSFHFSLRLQLKVRDETDGKSNNGFEKSRVSPLCVLELFLAEHFFLNRGIY